MYHNRLNRISAATLEPLRSTLELLEAYNNHLTRIEAYTFANFTRLFHLDLCSNQIEFIHQFAFANSSKLGELLLYNNSLLHVPARLFFSLVNIKKIDLTWQKSSRMRIDDYAFERDTSVDHQLSAVKIALSVTQYDAIQMGTRAFCSRNNNNDNKTRQSPFANIGEIDLNEIRDLSVSSCLLRQLKLNKINLLPLSQGHLTNDCDCEPLLVEEEHRFCEGRRELDCRLTKTTTIPTTRPTTNTTTNTIIPNCNEKTLRTATIMAVFVFCFFFVLLVICLSRFFFVCFGSCIPIIRQK